MNNGGTGVLLMRAFVEGRTLFWSFEPVLSRTASLPKGGMGVKVRWDSRPVLTALHENVMSHEYHRAVFSSRRHPGERSSWEFAITLPTVIDGFNDHNECEGAPRDLQHYVRAPPPTLRDTRNASIEYVLEAIIMPDDQAAPKLLLDERGMTDAAIVVRLPVPVMPSDHDTLAVDLAATPGFQVDPRAEAIVRTVRREQAPGAERFVAEAQLTGSLGRKLGTLTVEATTALPFVALRSAPSIIIPIAVSYAAGKSSLFGKASKDPAVIQRFTVAFAQRTSTRGGTDVKPHVLVQEVRSASPGRAEDSALPRDGRMRSVSRAQRLAGQARRRTAPSDRLRPEGHCGRSGDRSGRRTRALAQAAEHRGRGPSRERGPS